MSYPVYAVKPGTLLLRQHRQQRTRVCLPGQNCQPALHRARTRLRQMLQQRVLPDKYVNGLRQCCTLAHTQLAIFPKIARYNRIGRIFKAQTSLTSCCACCNNRWRQQIRILLFKRSFNPEQPPVNGCGTKISFTMGQQFTNRPRITALLCLAPPAHVPRYLPRNRHPGLCSVGPW